jgi:hypothetical protein
MLSKNSSAVEPQLAIDQCKELQKFHMNSETAKRVDELLALTIARGGIRSGERTRLAETDFEKDCAGGKQPHEESSRGRAALARTRAACAPRNHRRATIHFELSPNALTLFAHQIHRFVDNFSREVERGAKTD